MINYIFSLFQKPQKGFDPIPYNYAVKYFEQAYNGERFNKNIIFKLSQYTDLKNKTVLDLGAGPGQYTKYFVDKGAKVHYHDISKNYLTLFKNKFNNLEFTYSLDYLEKFTGTYDLIFNNVCFNYGMDDKNLVDKIAQGLNPGGVYFGILGNENIHKQHSTKTSYLNLIKFYLNDFFGLKIGHPYNSKRKIKKLFSENKFKTLAIEDFESNTLVVVTI